MGLNLGAIVAAATTALFLTVSSPAAAASVADWRADIDDMMKDLQAVHPAPFAKTGRLAFLRQAAALKADLPALSEEQRMVGAMRLVGLVGDGHTQLEPNRPDFALWYPIRIYEFTDGYFVTAAHRSVADLAGAQLLEVAGRPVAEAAAAARSLIGADNALGAQDSLWAFSDAALMKGLGYAGSDGRLSVTFKLANGEIATRLLPAHASDDPRYDKDDSSFEWHFQAEMGGPPFGGVDQWISVYAGAPYAAFRISDPTRPPRLMNRRGFTALALPAWDAYYIQANFVSEDFDKLFHDALIRVDRTKPRRLIVDLRYNFGGDGSHVPAMGREFIARQNARPWKELYIITGRRTLSAGIMAAAALMNNLDHSVIGEPMAAPINSYGDPITIAFKRAGMKLDVSTVFHQLGEAADITEFTPVDVPALMSFSDYASGRDPAVDPILHGDEMRSLATIALTDGGAVARKVYEARKARFSAYGWWSPPAEIELRMATQTLVDQGRLPAAIETARLNTEIHPDIWNTWYNLAKALQAAGQTKEALGNFQRVLEIDPANDNEGEIRKAFAAAGASFQPGGGTHR